MLEYLDQDHIFLSVKATSKKQMLMELASRLATLTGLDERDVFDALNDRERLGSTGVGAGVAIPHCKLSSIDKMYGIVARLDEPIAFDAVDDQPVDIFICLLAPESGTVVDHLKTLSKIGRIMREEETLAGVRAAENPRHLMKVFRAAADQSHAA